MKKIFLNEKHKNINKIRAINRLKRKIKHKKWKKWQNKMGQRRNAKEKRNIREEKEHTLSKTAVIAPKQFSFIEHPKGAIKLINELEELYLHNKPTFINLLEVQLLDYSAIAVLASILHTFKARNINFSGYTPQDENLRKLFIESDFFKYIRNQPTNEIKYTIGQDNQMFTTKDAKVNPELGHAIMLDSSMTIWGKRRTCKGLQRTLLELMQNANNHADLQEKGVKHWWLSVNHDKDNNKVSFVFVDYGIGIFKSLSNKNSDSKWHGWQDKLAGFIQSNDSVFKKLMDGELHKTVTGERFRGKGLPGIKQVLDRNQISKLHIISNDVFANISENRYNQLPQHFNGTFVCWELNNQNESSEWII